MLDTTRSFDPISVQRAIVRLSEGLQRRLVTQSEICKQVRIEKSKFSRWINRKSSWASIGEEKYHALMDFIENSNLFQRVGYVQPRFSNAPDIPFFGVAELLRIRTDDISMARDKLVGHYASYRYSHFAPPNVVCGALEIQDSSDTHALRTSELVRIPKEILGPGSSELEIRTQGYIWPTRNNMFVVFSEKNGSASFQTIYLNKQLNDSQPNKGVGLHYLEGIIVEWQEADCFVSKIFLQKIKSKLPDENIGILKERDVSEPILARLKERFTGPHNYLRAYK